MNEKVPVEWMVQRPGDGILEGERVDGSAGQQAAPVIRDRREIDAQWAQMQRQGNRSCQSCRYFSPPEDPETQAFLVDTHAIEAIEKECQITSRYSLPLMQGICHLTTKIVRGSAHIDVRRPTDFCDNFAPKNKLLSFFGMGRTR